MAEQRTKAGLWHLVECFGLRFTTVVVAAAPGAASRTERDSSSTLQPLLQCSLAAVM